VRNQIGIIKAASHAWIYLPVAVRGDYEFAMQFRRGKDDVSWTNVFLPVSGGRVRLHIVLGERPRIVLGTLAPDSPQTPPLGIRLQTGGRHRLKVVVKQVGDRVEVVGELNGRRAVTFNDVVSPHALRWMEEAPADTIGLETADMTLVYESATLRMLSGTAEILP
jgi:hypothetical protein